MFLASFAVVVGCVIFFLTYCLDFFLSQQYLSSQWGMKIACCLLSNIAMALGIQVVAMYEANGSF